MKTRAVRDGDFYVLNGVKRWITNARRSSEFYTVMAVTDPGASAPRASPPSWCEKGDEGVSFGALEKKLGIKGSPTREVYLDNVRIPADRMIGAEGTGFATAMTTPGPHPRHHRRPGPRHRPGRPGLRHRATSQERKQFGKADRRVPGHPVHAGRHGHEAGGRPPADLRTPPATSERRRRRP